jgi:hypothetical protein
VISELIAESRKGLSLLESALLNREMLPDSEQDAAIDYVLHHPDSTAYHVLFALKARSESVYRSIPAGVRAAVLCSALANLRYLNDWGHLAVSPKDGPAMRALIETGDAALPCLKALLMDRRPAPFFGSADATVASQYRRADFAAHAVARILKETPEFDSLPEERDRRLEELARRLG